MRATGLWRALGQAPPPGQAALSSLLDSQAARAGAGQCLVWAGGSQVRGWDGVVVSVPGGCTRTLLAETRDTALEVRAGPAAVTVNQETQQFTLEVEAGRALVTTEGHSLAVPGRSALVYCTTRLGLS